MKLAYSLKQKTKIAILLFLIMVGIILIRLLEDRSIKSMERALTSLHNDRLVPATDIFYIAEKLYAKRYLLESYVYNQKNRMSNDKLQQKIDSYNNDINTLLAKYEKTFLVTNEKDYLLQLKNKINKIKLLEKNILSNKNVEEKLAQKILFNSQVEETFLDISNTLSDLTKVQTKVGEQLQEESQRIVKATNLYSTIQLIIAIVIGGLIVAILSASNIMNIRSDKYNLN